MTILARAPGKYGAGHSTWDKHSCHSPTDTINSCTFPQVISLQPNKFRNICNPKWIHDLHLCIHSVNRMTTAPQLLPKPVLHTVRSSAPSFNFPHVLFSLTSSSCCLRPLPRLPMTFTKLCVLFQFPLSSLFLKFIQ